MNKEDVISKHTPICLYNGAGSKQFKVTTKNHHSKGVVKMNEVVRIRRCGNHLYKWCNKIGVEPVSDWNQLAAGQRPKDGGLCASVKES